MTVDTDTLPDAESLPATLLEREQWVCWRETDRDGKPTKVPVTPGTGAFASTTDPETWGGFEAALAYAEEPNVDGIGFVFTADDPLVGLDLDDCRDPETNALDDRARDIVDRLDSYTEVSPSGTGVHVLLTGSLPEGRNRRGDVELYETARFFTVTGNHIAETPTHVAIRQDALTAIHREYVQPSSDARSDSESTQSGHDEDTTLDLSDDELLSKALNASNGAKFERLWNGDTTGYDSHSEADMALCCLLAFWTGGDRTRMDRLFRRSDLDRPKWDDVHYADGSTYGEKTIERAIETTSEYYDPDRSDDTTPSQSRSQSPTSTPSADDDDAIRSRTYLLEKNRLLTDRIDELEATIERKNDRIETLETKLATLAAERTTRPSISPPADNDPPTHDETPVRPRDTDTSPNSPAEPPSLWTRTKRFLKHRSP